MLQVRAKKERDAYEGKQKASKEVDEDEEVSGGSTSVVLSWPLMSKPFRRFLGRHLVHWLWATGVAAGVRMSVKTQRCIYYGG